MKVPDYQVLRNRLSDPVVNVKVATSTMTTSRSTPVSLSTTTRSSTIHSVLSGFSIFDLGSTLRAAKADVLSKISTEPLKTDNYEVGAFLPISPTGYS